MISITVHVPERRVEEFYIRFGEFIADAPNPEAPARTDSGLIPAWVLTDEAQALATRLWNEISLLGHSVLLIMSRAATEETAHLAPDEIARTIGHPNGKSGIAGILGGVGKAIRRAELPIYTSPTGAAWHYIWDWNGEYYSMTPEVARLLRAANDRR